MDAFKNFARGTVNALYDASATSIALAAGHGARFPATPFNATWYDSTTYPNPEDDPNVEVVRVTAISTDTLTIARAQEGTAATAKNTAGKTYMLRAGLTAKTLTDDLLLLNPRRGLYVVDHFTSQANTGDTGWTVTASGASATVARSGAAPTDNHQGVLRATTGTTATGVAILHRNDGGMYLGGGEWQIEGAISLGALSDATDEYIFRFGFGDALSNVDNTDGVYFEYDRLSSTNWRAKTSANSVRTAAATSTAVATGYVRLGIVVNAAGTSAFFYINGVLVHTETLTIPTGVSRLLTPHMWLGKSAGTNARTANVDYIWFQNLFTTPIP